MPVLNVCRPVLQLCSVTMNSWPDSSTDPGPDREADQQWLVVVLMELAQLAAGVSAAKTETSPTCEPELNSWLLVSAGDSVCFSSGEPL